MGVKMYSKIIINTLLVLLVCSAINSAFAAPGILQVVTRPGFWANDFPDRIIYLQHYYNYSADFNTPTGDVDFEQNLSLTRFFKPWHFGEEDQYQFIALLAIPAVDIEIDHDHFARGIADPLTYTSFGWNDVNKEHHIQVFTITRYPVGNSDLSAEAFAIMPGLAYERRWGNWMWDLSTGYWIEFERRGADSAKGQNFWEVNSALTYRTKSGLSLYVQGDYKNTGESEILGVKQNNDGDNFGAAIGAGYWLTQRLQLDAKLYKDISSDNEATDNGKSLNIRLAYVF
tara:strand:- start:40865 stop:41722 length:858 start_codon:yes stop_codon:yes gene_type:complete